MTAAAFDVDAAARGARRAGPPSPVPMPDDLRDGFVDAYWRSLAWRQTRRGSASRCPNAPTDLFTYQELVNEVRPDWIIETGTGDGGRALFLASCATCSATARCSPSTAGPATDLPAAPRITYLAGRAHDEEVVDQVRRTSWATTPKGLVILGTRGARRRMHLRVRGLRAVRARRLLRGHGAHRAQRLPGRCPFGPGPFEALRRIINTRGDFVADNTRERHGLSFNPGGFLRRVR